MFNKLKDRRGFTLIEVLLVVAIIAILAGIVILAINPGKQLGDSRNARRRVDVQTIANGVYQYEIDNQGNLPPGITTNNTFICRSDAQSCAGLVDLTSLTNQEKYLVGIPTDPQDQDANSTRYQIQSDNNGRITVTAPDAELGQTISITK